MWIFAAGMTSHLSMCSLALISDLFPSRAIPPSLPPSLSLSVSVSNQPPPHSLMHRTSPVEGFLSVHERRVWLSETLQLSIVREEECLYTVNII